VGRGSSVGIATELRPGRSGDRISMRASFSATVQIDPPIQQVQVLFPGVKAAGAMCQPPTPSSAEVKVRV